MYTVPQYIVEYQRELYRYLCQETKKKRKRKKEREREKTEKNDTKTSVQIDPQNAEDILFQK